MGTGGPKKRSRVGVRGDDIASEVINHFWMGHAPETMSVTYSRLHWKLGLRFAEAQSMGVGFTAARIRRIRPPLDKRVHHAQSYAPASFSCPRRQRGKAPVAISGSRLCSS